MHRAYTIAEMTPGPLHARGPLLAATNDEREPLDPPLFDEDETCPVCSGSGEGMFDGTRCRECGGRGILRIYE